MIRKVTLLCGLLLALMVVGVYVMNINCIAAHDALSYAFDGQGTPMEGEIPRVASLMDIVRQQWGDYTSVYGNGRVWTHGLVAFFMGFKLYHLFDLLNTGMWFLLVVLVLCEGQVQLKGRGLWPWLLGASIVWWFLWFAETCCLNAAFTVNYLWTAVATLGMMALWRHLTSWWLVPLAFIYGWTQEAFVLPMLGALALSALIRSLVERRIAITSRQAVAWVLMLIGACFLCFGPAAMGRAETQLTLGAILATVIRTNLGLLLLGSPIVLICSLLWILWTRRHALGPMFMRSLEWWCYFVTAYGLYCLVASAGVVRLSMPLLLAGTILFFREREVFCKVSQKIRISVVTIVFLWLVIAVCLQVRVGIHARQMTDLYRNDPQGITMRPSETTGCFQFSVGVGIYNRWHRMLFRREFNHTHDPLVLSPWLYETLYEHPEAFFAEARALEEGTLYVAPRAPRLVVQKGEEPLTSSQQAILERYFAHQSLPPTDWTRFLPGRLKTMFPQEDDFLALPSSHVTITAKDGQRYSLYMTEEK